MIRFLIASTALALAACVAPATTDPAELPAGEWTLDADHASVTWRVRHLGLSWYTARFDRAEARLSFDPAAPEAAQVTAAVDAASISTGDAAFDETLRGSGWFDVQRHPQIIFESTRIEILNPTSGLIHGRLTLKGVTADAVLETEFYGGTFNPLEGAQALGFGADLVLDRTEFGVGRLPGNFIGDEVRVRIEAEFLRD